MTTDGDQPSNTDEGTGLTLLRSWPRVYAFVLIFFALMVIALVWLTRAYS